MLLLTGMSMKIKALFFVLLVCVLLISSSPSAAFVNITQVLTILLLDDPDGFLQGDDAAPAIPQITAYENIQGVENNDVVIAPGPDGQHIALTQLEVWINDSATVGEVNQALESVDAQIISMIPNVPILLIEIDRPADFAALQNIAAQLLAFDAINKVDLVSMYTLASLPQNHDSLNISELQKIHQLISTKNIAARNAKGALSSSLSEPPTIIVADQFGGGKPGPAFDIVTDITDYRNGASNLHGYHVLGIISGLAGGDSLVTGAYPDTAFIKAIDIQLSPTKTLSSAEIDNCILLTVLKNKRQNFVVNSSLGTECDDPPGPCSDEFLRKDAFKFISKVRNAGLENNYLHVVAAGNTEGGFTFAYQNIRYNYAALRSDIIDELGNTILPLSNVISVENVITTNVSAETPPEAICLNSGSVSQGHISAPGTRVTSFINANGAEGEESGSSMAAPLVTATAAYLWALKPDLSPQILKQRLINTAEPVALNDFAQECALAITPQPFLDTYRTILTGDSPASLNNIDLPAGRIRGTILDVADSSGNEGSNEQFDEKDIENFLLIFDTQNTADKLDYSRYDLNGDGWTGGSKSTAFDLDMDRVIEQHVTQSIGGKNVEFDESALSDEGILCYYAYSNLYTGDTDIRDNLIGNQCGMDDCIYKVATYIPEAPSYFKYCRRSNVPGIFQLTHSSTSGFHTIRVEQEVCNEPQYNLDDECPGDNYNLRITMIWSEWYPGPTISLEIDYLNNLQVSTDYNCSAEGELTKFPSDPGTDGIIGQYDTLDACYTVLKTYIPLNPSAFDYPGDCHDWWDHAGETCVY